MSLVSPMVLSDNVGSRRFPLVTFGLVAVCVLFHIYNTLFIGGLPHSVETLFGVNNAAIMRAFESGDATFIADKLSRIFVYMFVHTGWLHLTVNMISLCAFGPALEERLGRLYFFGLYVLCGVMAVLLHLFIYANVSAYAEASATIGASPAIFGLMGAYLVFWPNAKLFGFLLPIPYPLHVKATWVICFTGLLEILDGLLTNNWFAGGHNHLAHLLGLSVGVALAWPIWRFNLLQPPPSPEERRTLAQRLVHPVLRAVDQWYHGKKAGQ
jgi:membrane associated rhomboid family serine protease